MESSVLSSDTTQWQRLYVKQPQDCLQKRLTQNEVAPLVRIDPTTTYSNPNGCS